MTAPTAGHAKRLLPTLGVAVVVALTLASGAIQGKMSNRWGPPPAMLAAAKRIEEFPSRFGAWQQEGPSEEMGKDVVNMLECAGYFVRQYVNQDSGQSVKVAVLLGPPGPISVHTPEICFSSREFQTEGETQRVPVETTIGTHEFWNVHFRSKRLETEALQVYYGWSTGGRWTAAKDPRFAFAADPYLYKIQLAASVPPVADPQAYDPCRDFLADFIPAASGYLIEPDKDR